MVLRSLIMTLTKMTMTKNFPEVKASVQGSPPPGLEIRVHGREARNGWRASRLGRVRRAFFGRQ
ncbi:MAG: hypothetical protein LBU12_07875 [Deltaproteobacteria bacterium]|nr:hypothetical protein [Deltaproteobacteria bacterium]